MIVPHAANVLALFFPSPNSYLWPARLTCRKLALCDGHELRTFWQIVAASFPIFPCSSPVSLVLLSISWQLIVNTPNSLEHYSRHVGPSYFCYKQYLIE